jgi:hypothetical protein
MTDARQAKLHVRKRALHVDVPRRVRRRPNEGPGNALGDGGHRLHAWFSAGADADHKGSSARLAGVDDQIWDELAF